MRARKGSKAQASLFSVEQLVPIPNTGWAAPTEFPRLEAAKVICIDVETYDPHIKERGPGWATGDGHLVGIAVGTDDGHRWYFPMRHEVGGGNLDPDMVLRWAKDELTRPGQLKVGANLMYDLGWLAAEGVDVPGPYYDVQWAEALLDEHRTSYSLDAIALDYGLGGKMSNELYQWCSQAYGGKPDGRQRANIYQAPACLVGPYAEGDVDLPLRIREQQVQKIEQLVLHDLLDLEHRLIPMLLAMRQRGVRIREDWPDIRGRLAAEAKKVAPAGVDIWSAASLAAYCDQKGIQYPRTPKGAPSFVKGWLEKHLPDVARARKLDKACGTFFDGYMGKAVDWRIHCEFHPLRSDSGGTVSGRFSSSNPNLQNIPSRDPELGPLIRGLFIPEEGCLWAKLDYSQVEYRLLAHYARGRGADDVREAYRRDPTTDFHAHVAEMSGLERKPAKNLNFGMVYGQGLATTAATMGCSLEEAEQFRQRYFDEAPFVKYTFDWVSRVAANRGYIRSIGGRIHRFPYWEPIGKWNEGYLPRAEAEEKWGKRIRRARTHKALNALLQGSAADIMKMAMAQIWESGVCDVLGAPHLTVHDELDFSMPDTPEGRDAILEVKRIMETCVKLNVPLVADVEIGPDWANINEL